MLYFSYGANLNAGEMTRPRKCPTAVYVANGRLDDMCVSLCNFPTGTALKLNRSKGSVVFGVIYDISDSHEWSMLVGSNQGLRHTNVKIRLMNSRRTVNAVTFEAEPMSISRRAFASAGYSELVLEGAMNHRLPDVYISSLKTVLMGKGTPL